MVGRRGDGGIRGFRIDDEIVCRDCIEEEELEESTERDIITKNDLRIHFFSVLGARGSCDQSMTKNRVRYGLWRRIR